jgi:hypothetical protein
MLLAHTPDVAKYFRAVEIDGLGVGPELVRGSFGEVASVHTVSKGGDKSVA